MIAAAVRGDLEAVNRVLDFYSGYIAALSTRRGYDQNGNPCLAVDEEIRRQIEADHCYHEFRPELNSDGI